MLGIYIQIERSAQGMSEKRLAELCGCSRASINRIANTGHSPSFYLIEKVFKALKVRFSDYEHFKKKNNSSSSTREEGS